MSADRLVLVVDPELWVFLPAGRRRVRVEVAWDQTSSFGHVVEATGIPLTEVAELVVPGDGAGAVADGGGPTEVHVLPHPRPQVVDGWTGGFVLDVHLGALARRLRLLGLDVAWPEEAGDPALVERANAEHRLLLTRDRGLLKRRALWAGAYVRGSDPDDQLVDVLDRFRPALAPWSRCTSCNAALAPVTKDEVRHLLEPGTLRSQDTFVRCLGCGRVYWPGAHVERLRRVVAAAGAGGVR